MVVDSVELLGEGDHCVAYLVNEEWVVRFAKHEEAVASLRREACLLPQIAHRFDVCVPSLEILRLDAELAFGAHRLLAGPALTRERFFDLEDTDRNRCASQVAAFLVRLHSTDVAMARSCGLRVTDFVSRCAHALAGARQTAAAHLSAADKAFIESRLAAAPQVVDPVLLHGDLSPDHVMYDESAPAVSAIIDFGDVCLGDPAWDLVYIYEDYGLDFLNRFLRAYRPPDPRSLLERMYRLHLLDLTEWVVACANVDDDRLDAAVAELSAERVEEDKRRNELFSACLG